MLLVSLQGWVSPEWEGVGSVCAYPAWGSFMLNRGGAHSFHKQNRAGQGARREEAPLSPRAPSWLCSGNQSFAGALKLRRKLSLAQTAGQHLPSLSSHSSLLFFAVVFWAQPKSGFKKGRGESTPPRTQSIR